MCKIERLAEKKRAAMAEYESIMSGKTIASYGEQVAASNALNSAFMEWHYELISDDK